jgi:flagellin
MATTLPPAGTAQDLLAQSARRLEHARERLASGRRINTASDDAAGLAVASELEAATRRDAQASRNISDGISAARLADQALRGTAEGLERLAELAARAANGLLSDGQRQAIQAEADALVAEIDRSAATTALNGTSLLQGGDGVEIHASGSGDPASQIAVPTSDASAAGLGVDALDLGSEAGARAALDSLGAASGSVAAARAGIGAAESRLTAAAGALRVQREQTAAAAGRIADADVAAEAANEAAAGIQARVGVAVAAQANQRAHDVLRLLG